MKVCACICELNPFHNGHEYLFREARRLTGADYIIAVMSGDFVQRGLPAICDKYARCRQALMGGADLVVELPVMYATASADYFAQGAISAITGMGCVDFLVFGSECGDIGMLRTLAGLSEENNPGLHILSRDIDSTTSKNYRITQLLREGKSYTRAYTEVSGNDLAPNDMLAVRFLKSLDMLDSDIEPVCVSRAGGGYNDATDKAWSALAVRRRISEREDFAHIVPKYVYRNLQSLAGKSFPIYQNDFGIQLYTVISKIIEEGESVLPLTDYMDVSENIAGHIRNDIGKFGSYESFAGLVHSKEYTKSRIYRALLHILLGIKKSDYPEYLEDCEVSYIRILGFRQSSAALLSQLKENCTVPVISKAADYASILDDEAIYYFHQDLSAANMYDMAAVFKFGKTPAHDLAREIVIV